jgi:hypothetical protein
MTSDSSRIDAPAPAPVAAPEPAGDSSRALGIAGFVLSFFAVLNIVGFILSIVALVGSRRAGVRNRFALWGLVISSIGILVGVVIAIAVGSMLIDAAQTCTRLGEGVHVIDGRTYTCTPTSFYVRFGS